MNEIQRDIRRQEWAEVQKWQPGKKGRRKRLRVWRKTHGHCWYCGRKLFLRTQKKYSMHVEHMTPRNRGGSNTLDNLVPSCQTCNGRKGTKTVDEFREYILGDGLFWAEIQETKVRGTE